MIVLPVPGSSASRKRNATCGSIISYTAATWCGYGCSGTVASADPLDVAAARRIHSAHNPASTIAESAPPSVSRTSVVAASVALNSTFSRPVGPLTKRTHDPSSDGIAPSTSR